MCGQLQQQPLQDAAGGNPRRDVIAVAGDEQQVRGGGDFFAVAVVLAAGVKHEADDEGGEPARQVGCAHHRVAETVARAFAVFAVVANPRQQFVLEGGVAHLRGVARHDQRAEAGKGGAAVLPGVQLHTCALAGGEDIVQCGRRDAAAIGSGAVGLATGDLCKERVGDDAGLLLQGDGNRAVGGDVGSGRVAVMAGGDAQVFRRAAEADKEFAVVGVNDRQAFTEIGGDGDAACAEGEAPRLGVVAGGGADGVFDEGRECGVFHGVLRVAGKV